MTDHPLVERTEPQIGPRASDSVCSIAGVTIKFSRDRLPAVHVLSDATLSIAPGESVGIVGETGSGKSMLCQSILGLLPTLAETSGSVYVNGLDMVAASPRERRQVRGRQVGYVMQDPTSSLNPVLRLRTQLREAAKTCGIAKTDRDRVIDDQLQQVGLRLEDVGHLYPWELSGGMNQRIVIAMALVQEPQLLIADEPTTALDVTSEASVLTLLRRLLHVRRMSLIIVSHDISVVARVADRVAVMYAGRIVEVGPTEDVLADPRHPYTAALLSAMPRLTTDVKPLYTIPGELMPVSENDTGCPFRARCLRATERCGQEFPSETLVEPRSVWCWNPVAGETWRNPA